MFVVSAQKTLEERIKALSKTFAYQRLVRTYEELKKDPRNQEKFSALAKAYNAVSNLFFKQIEFHCRAVFKPSHLPIPKPLFQAEAALFSHSAVKEAFSIAQRELSLFFELHERIKEANRRQNGQK